MSNDTPEIDGAGGDAPLSSNGSGAILCVDGAEARLLRREGNKCVTSAKLRRVLADLLSGGAESAPQEAAEAVRRLGGVSTAATPERWRMWACFKNSEVVQRAFGTLPEVLSPLRDPEDPITMGTHEIFPCSDTTVLVARDTFELVRAADTYAGFDCYRPTGRMDEPFTPREHAVCLVTSDELRLVRLADLPNVSLVLTYSPSDTQETTGRAVTHWPTPVRALCGEYPSLRVVVATCLVAGRCHYPFFLGRTRGIGYETTTETDPNSAGAVDYCVETDTRAETVGYKVVVWAGDSDMRQLVRYGGLSIFTGGGHRRKVQLRSLGLASSGVVAGAPIYDLSANLATLQAWAITRTFVKPGTAQRDRNRRRVRCKQASLKYARGTSIIHNTSPRRIRVTPSKNRQAANMLRQLCVAERLGEAGVTTVPLKTLRCGGVYYLNGRGREKDGVVSVDRKRCKIRCPRWEAGDPAGMLGWLAEQSCVIMAGLDATGAVFAIIRVANGTEDQQTEAVCRWCEEAGRLFAHESGACSWRTGSVASGSFVRIEHIEQTNWKALPLETAVFERYQTQGDYSKPLKLTRRGVATLTERAKAYADTIPLDEEGARNTNLATGVYKMVELFGKAATAAALPAMLARSTLPEKEKRKTALRILHGAKR